MNTIVYNATKFNWFNIDQRKMKFDFNSIGINLYPIDEYKYIKEDKIYDFTNVDLEENFLGFRLYDLTIYNICNDLIIFKDELEIKLHGEVISKWFLIAKDIITEFLEVFKNNKFSLVIVINGHSLLDACLLAFAKKYNLPFLCIENTSNKNRVVWDNVSGKVVTYNLAKKYFHKFKNKVNSQECKSYAIQFRNSVFDNKNEEHISNLTNLQVPFKVPYILFLGQVYCDAAQLFAIKDDFKNPIIIIKNIIDICSKLNIPLVIKLHPKEIEGVSPAVNKLYDFPTYKRIKKYESEHVFIDHLNVYNTFKLIEKSQIVITVNSQAGLEACLYDKPVLTYQNNFYSGLGFTYDYENNNELNKKIKYLIENRIENNKNLVSAQKFFYIFFEKYCFKRSITNLLFKIIKSGFFEKKIIFNYLKLIIKKRIKSYLAVVRRSIK